jgi:type II secretion system protein N
MNASIEIRQIPIQDFMDVPSLVGRTLEGNLGGDVSYNGTRDLPLAGAGQADLRISNGKLLLSQPLLGLDAVRFDELLIQMTFKNMSVNLTRVELFGQQLQGSLSGNIRLRRDIPESRLNLRGTVEPFAALFESVKGADENVMIIRQQMKQGRLTFVITGTLAEPRLRFI